jgi:putative thioredoxin
MSSAMSEFAFDVSALDFEARVLEASHQQPVLVDFWAEWCGPCKVLKPLLEKLAAEYQGKFLLAKVDSDKNQAVAQAYGVRSIPTVKVISAGEVVDEFAGALPEGQIRAFIDRLLPTPADKLLREAIALREAGNPEAALSLLGEASQLEPENENIRIEATDILLDAGKTAEAQALLDSLKPTTRMEDRIKPLLAKLSFSLGEKSGASEVDLRQRIAQDPRALEARLALANLHIASQRYAEGMDELLTLIQLDRSWQDEIARKTLLQVFLLPAAASLVPHYRRKLSSALN